MPGDRLSVAVVAELREFERRLSLIPEIGGVEAKKLAGQIRKELKNAEDGAGASASKIGKALGGIGDVVEKGLKKLGPLGGEVADVLFDFGAPLAEAALGVGEVTSGLGAAGMAATVAGGAVLGIGAALAVAVVGAGLLVAGATAVTEAAIVATDRLDAMGMASRVPEESREALDRYQGATARLWAEVDVLTTQLGAALAPALTALADVVGDLIEWFNELDKSFDAVRSKLDELVDMLPEWARWEPAIKLVEGAVDALEQTYDGLVETSKSAKLAPTQAEIDRWGDLKKAKEAAESDEMARRRKEAIDAIEAELAAQLELADLQQYVADNIDEWIWQSKQDAYAAELRALDAIIDAIIRRRDEDNKTTETSVNNSKKRRSEAVSEAQDYLASTEKIARAVEDLANFAVEQYARREAAGEQLTLAEQRAANKAFRIAQTAAIAQVAIHLATAFAGFVATYSALGPGAILAAVGEVAAAAAAIAPILGQTPPYPGAARSGGGGAPQVAPTDVGPAPDTGDNVRDDGYGSAPDVVGSGKDRSSRSAQPGDVVVTVVFPGGRVGKRRVAP